jgi:hypothetical protein
MPILRRPRRMRGSLKTSEAKQPESCFAITLTVIAIPRCTVILF